MTSGQIRALALGTAVVLVDTLIARCACGAWRWRGRDCRVCQIIEHDECRAAFLASLRPPTPAQVRAAERAAWGEAVRAAARAVAA